MMHPLHDVTPGEHLPLEFNALVEIPMGSSIKYELDKKTGLLRMDRVLYSAVYYPANYGFIPQTLSDDGDPLDVLVLSNSPVVSGAVVRCRPVGALVMTDQAGQDEKIIAVPTDDLFPYYKEVQNYTELPDILLRQVAHFFQHYKDLEPNKWTKIGDWIDAMGAERLIMEGIARAKAKSGHG